MTNSNNRVAHGLKPVSSIKPNWSQRQENIQCPESFVCSHDDTGSADI